MAVRRFAPVLILAAVILAISLAAFLFVLQTVVPAQGNLFDFYPNWVGSRAVLAGESPYSAEVTRRIQLGSFGTAIPAGVDQFAFAHPAYSAFAVFPVVQFDAPVAIAIWMTIQLISMGLCVILWIHLFHWKPHPLALGLVFFLCLFVFRYPMNVFLLGQFTGTVLLGFTLAVWLASRKRDVAAGAALVLCMVPPTMGIGLAAALIIPLLLTGRWKVLAAWVVLMTFLTVLSFLAVGFWVPDWLAMLRMYTELAFPVWPPSLLGSPLAGLILAAAGVSLVAYDAVRLVRRAGPARIRDLGVSAALCVFFLFPATGNYYLVLVLPALVALLASKSWAARILALGIILSPWFFLANSDGSRTSFELLAVPLAAFIGWCWVRWLGKRAIRPAPLAQPE
ncbi:MAG: DUF2029 domain-containing protein [Anaerolineae bacterium]|nr:DUF2029 domain-containing protein [Anaerolineae bacterium]